MLCGGGRPRKQMAYGKRSGNLKKIGIGNFWIVNHSVLNGRVNNIVYYSRGLTIVCYIQAYLTMV